MGKQAEQRHSTDQLWRFFEEFCVWDRAAGGPDPHMKVMGWMCDGEPLEDRLWAAGCYMATYVVPSAEVLRAEFPWERARLSLNAEFHDFLSENWDGMVLRRERRAVNTPTKLVRYLSSYAAWVEETIEGAPWLGSGDLPPEIAYEEAWEDIQQVWGLGRYIAIKGLEFMSRYCGANTAIPDIRANGGWSPRKALAYLWPEHAGALNGGNDLGSVDLAERLAVDTQSILADRAVILSMYEVQTLLCDWKQCYFGRRQYPGRSQDSEYAHAQKVFSHFTEFPTRLWEAREALFAPEVLAERNGWEGVREELGECQSLLGFTWSDFLFDFDRTEDLICPVAA